MTNKFTSSNAEKTKWIHLTTDVKFSQQCYFECLGRFGICDNNTDDQGQKITPGVEMLQADVRDDLPISGFDPTAPTEQIRITQSPSQPREHWRESYSTHPRCKVRQRGLSQTSSESSLSRLCPTHKSVINIFFPSNAFMASARSFNTFNCML